jgi:hypothetical protein
MSDNEDNKPEGDVPQEEIIEEDPKIILTHEDIKAGLSDL